MKNVNPEFNLFRIKFLRRSYKICPMCGTIPDVLDMELNNDTFDKYCSRECYKKDNMRRLHLYKVRERKVNEICSRNFKSMSVDEIFDTIGYRSGV